MRRLLAAAVSVALLVGPAPAPAAAQEATPPPGAEVLSAEACTVDPIAPARFLAVLATPVPAEAATPAAGLPASGGDLSVASEAEFPAGPPADPATATAVAAAARQFVACLNAGDNGRLLALLSDGLLRSFAAGVDLPTEAELAAELATPAVPEEEPGAILELRDARVLADGRVGIVLVADTPTDDEGPGSGLLIFVNADGRWLLDATVAVESAEE